MYIHKSRICTIMVASLLSYIPSSLPHSSPPSILVPSSLQLWLFVDDDILQQREQRLMGLLPWHHKAPVALDGWRGSPAEVTHPVGGILLGLKPQLRGRLGAGPPPAPLPSVLHAVQLPTGLQREALGGISPLQSKHLDGPAFAAAGLAPAEVLHGVGAPLLTA